MGFVKRVTGPGVTTRVGMEFADLGAMAWDPKRKALAIVFGDSFSFSWGQDWMSPVVLSYNEELELLGIPSGTTEIVSEGMRRQCLDYVHGQDQISTILPCDLMLLNGRWILSAMIIGPRGLGDERATQFFESHDLVHFTKTGPSLEHFDANGRPAGHPGNVMLTHDRHGAWVFIAGTGGLARDKSIWLWRCAADTFPDGEWEPRGWNSETNRWNWGAPNEDNPILQGRFGELSLRFLQGQPVLAGFDVDHYSCFAITVADITDNWLTGNRITVAHGHEFAQLYGGYISPLSKLNEPNGMRFTVSQWETSTNRIYHVLDFQDTLQAQGPLIVELPEPEPEPEPPPLPETPKPTPPAEGGAMTPQELYELLLRELSASGAVKITTPEGDNITLREAVEQVFWKERGPHGLEGGRPRHPNTKDDQLGQVLSMRAEGLFTQTLVYELAKKAGIDVAKLYAQVQKSLS